VASTTSFILIQDDVFDLDEPRLERSDILDQLLEVTVHLTAALVNAIVEFAVAWQNVHYD
jgi:hypothetical protein